MSVQEVFDNDRDFVLVAVDCDSEERYVEVLANLGIERNDVVDEKSAIRYTQVDGTLNRTLVSYNAGKPEATESNGDSPVEVSA